MTRHIKWFSNRDVSSLMLVCGRIGEKGGGSILFWSPQVWTRIIHRRLFIAIDANVCRHLANADEHTFIQPQPRLMIAQCTFPKFVLRREISLLVSDCQYIKWLCLWSFNQSTDVHLPLRLFTMRDWSRLRPDRWRCWRCMEMAPVTLQKWRTPFIFYR